MNKTILEKSGEVDNDGDTWLKIPKEGDDDIVMIDLNGKIFKDDSAPAPAPAPESSSDDDDDDDDDDDGDDDDDDDSEDDQPQEPKNKKHKGNN